MRWTLIALMGDEGDERAEKLTRDAWKQGVTPAQLWAMPSAHLKFLYFESDAPEEIDQDLIDDLIDKNAGKVRPYAPAWLFPEGR